MLESNALEIKLKQLPMSIQQSYEVMLGICSQCSLKEYRMSNCILRQLHLIILIFKDIKNWTFNIVCLTQFDSV